MIAIQHDQKDEKGVIQPVEEYVFTRNPVRPVNHGP